MEIETQNGVWTVPDGVRFVICAVREIDRWWFLYTGLNEMLYPQFHSLDNPLELFRAETCLTTFPTHTAGEVLDLIDSWKELPPCAGLRFSMLPVIVDLTEDRASLSAVCHVPIGTKFIPC